MSAGRPQPGPGTPGPPRTAFGSLPVKAATASAASCTRVLRCPRSVWGLGRGWGSVGDGAVGAAPRLPWVPPAGAWCLGRKGSEAPDVCVTLSWLDLNSREQETCQPVHVINVDIQDNHEEATLGAFLICELCQCVSMRARSAQAGSWSWPGGSVVTRPDAQSA